MRTDFEDQCPGCQLAVVNYDDVENLRYTLQGVDLVISTIAGVEQLNLIDAARRARVRTFVPSEFEGDLSHRPADDPLDRGGQSARGHLAQQPQSRSYTLSYTVFSCGIFMERFAPGGLQVYDIGAGSGIQAPNDYLVNITDRQAEIVACNAHGRPAQVSLTSVHDVARFVTSAIELGLAHWPREFRMRGDTMTLEALVRTCSDVRGGMLPQHHFTSPTFPPKLNYCYSLIQSRCSPLPRGRDGRRTGPDKWKRERILLSSETTSDGQWTISRPLPQPSRFCQPKRSNCSAANQLQGVA